MLGIGRFDKHIFDTDKLIQSLIEVLDSPVDLELIKIKTFENSHPSFLFIFIDLLEPITLSPHYLTDCSHDAILPSGKLTPWCMVSLQ